ncbi:MAG TPA: hypothetical protein VN035_05365, partial [Microbacterium sp.]|nr:hypothetical protein [Microbacterium sp.]
LRATRVLWRRRTGASGLALTAGIGVYAIGQIAGYALAQAIPHVHDNPAFAADRSQSPWIIDYPAFALQAFALYAMTTLGVAVYAWLMRALSLREVRSVTTLTRRPGGKISGTVTASGIASAIANSDPKISA